MTFQCRTLFNQAKFRHSFSNTVSRAIPLAQRVNLANLFDMIYAGIYKHNPVIRSSDLIHKLPTRWMKMQRGKEGKGQRGQKQVKCFAGGICGSSRCLSVAVASAERRVNAVSHTCHVRVIVMLHAT